MKRPKKLNKFQKEKLRKKNIDVREYVLVDEDRETFTIQKKDQVGPEYPKEVFHQ